MDSKSDQNDESSLRTKGTTPHLLEDGGDETGLYELLLEEMGGKCAREVREFAREASRYGENSYSYKMNLLMVAYLRLGSRMPRHFEAAINKGNAAFDAQLQARLEEFLAKIEIILKQYNRPIKHSIWSSMSDHIFAKLPKGALGLDRTPNVGPHNTITPAVAPVWSLRGFFEILFLRHMILLVCGMSALTFFFGVTLYWKQRVTIQEARNRDVVRMATWQKDQLEKQNVLRVEQAALVAQERERNLAEAQRQIAEETNKRFEELVPVTYRLAQQLESSARRVDLHGEPQAWEVTLTEKQGLIEQHLTYEDHGPVLKVYLRNEPDRLALSTTTPSEERSRSKVSAKAGGR